MISAFDPQSFLDATMDQPLVKRPPLSAGKDFVGIIGEVKPRPWQGKKDPTQSGIAMDIPVEIDLSAYPEEKARLGADKLMLTDSIMLDLNAAGSIDNGPGKNGKLRRYREALDLNKAGDVFSFRNMQGRSIKVKIGHREYQGDIFDEIAGVAKA